MVTEENLSYIERMALWLRALSGPLQGQQIAVKVGTRFGREKGEVRLNDSKVSSLHAFVTEEVGELVLNDNGSKNGLRRGDDRVTSLVLRPGVEFTIGRSDFRVEGSPPTIALDEDDVLTPQPTAKPPLPLEPQTVVAREVSPAPAQPAPGVEPKSPKVQKPEPKKLAPEKIEAPAQKPTAKSSEPQKTEPAPSPAQPVEPKSSETKKAESKRDPKPAPPPAEPKKAQKAEAKPTQPQRSEAPKSEPIKLEFKKSEAKNREALLEDEDLSMVRRNLRRWNEVLANLTIEATGRVSNQPHAVAPLVPAVRLTFIGGVQAETRWVLGYGPRRAGAGSLDLPIFESQAPEVCFEIVPSAEGVTFRTNHPKQVTINGEPTHVRTLADGDLIVIGLTRIEVGLLK